MDERMCWSEPLASLLDEYFHVLVYGRESNSIDIEPMLVGEF